MNTHSETGPASHFFAVSQGARSCEKIDNLTQRRQGAKTREEQGLCFLCALCDFAALRETLLLVQGLFHSLVSLGGEVIDGVKTGSSTESAPMLGVKP